MLYLIHKSLKHLLWVLVIPIEVLDFQNEDGLKAIDRFLLHQFVLRKDPVIQVNSYKHIELRVRFDRIKKDCVRCLPEGSLGGVS